MINHDDPAEARDFQSLASFVFRRHEEKDDGTPPVGEKMCVLKRGGGGRESRGRLPPVP